MNRIAQPEDISDIKVSDLKQTGNFNHQQQPFKASVSPLRSRTPIRSSSSSSEEFKYRKKKPVKQQSPKSHISNKSPSLISRFKVQQQASEVFCVTCEQFIGADLVNRHRCQSKDDSIDMKLAKIYELLLLRKVSDQNLKTLIQIIAACTMEIYESLDSYTLQRCLEDICVLKSQVQQCQDEQTYNILILTGKVHQYLLAKMESIRQPVIASDNQTQISYTNTNTNFTIRKRLFSEQKSIIPKQLINKNFKPELVAQTQKTQENEKPGIQHGNKFDSAKKQPFIELTAQVQVQPQEPPSEKKAPKSIISQISGFLSQISLNNNQGNERQKKAFFDLAVKKKQILQAEHPAQFIPINDLYEQCKRQQVSEENWEKWIDNVFKAA